MAEMLTNEQKYDLFSKYYKYFDSFVKVQVIGMSKRYTPYLTYGVDDECYYNSDKNVIHIGIGRFQCADEKDFVVNTMYVLGHECGHIKHTTRKSWNYAMTEGTRRVCEEISARVEGRGVRRFLKDSDYDKFISDMVTKYGVAVSMNTIQQIVHFVCNSIEDGREERLQAKRYEQFKYRMIYCRGRERNEYVLDPDDDLVKGVKDKEAGAVLTVKMNQILSLATTGYYQKGYLECFDGDPIEDQVDDLIDDISEGVLAPSCRKGMQAALNIIDKLIDDIIEVAKNDELGSMMKSLLEALADACMPGNPGESDASYGTSEKEEEVPDEDEAPDEGDLPEDSPLSKKGKDEDEAEGDKKSSSVSGSEDGDDDGAESAVGSSAGTGTSGEGDEGSSDEDRTGGAKSLTGVAVDGLDDTSEVEGGTTPDGRTKSSGKGDFLRNKSAKDLSSPEEMEKRILDDMKKAADNAASAVDDLVSKGETYVPPVIDTTKIPPVKPSEDIAKEYDYDVRFREFTRNDSTQPYDLNLPMPADLQMLADKFQGEIKDALELKNSKPLRHKRHGSIDGKGLYKFVTGDIDMFTRKAEPYRFDGCAYFLVDNSGSMGCGAGSKREEAWKAMSIIESGFSEMMPLKIAAFDAGGPRDVYHEMVKGFDEKQPVSCSYNFLVQGRAGYGNKDGYSIRVATQEIAARPEEQKIMIILSDGVPTDYYGGYPEGCSDVKDAVQKAREQGILVIPVYFAPGNLDPEEVSNYYDMYGKDQTICCHPEEIGDRVIAVLKNFANL